MRSFAAFKALRSAAGLVGAAGLALSANPGRAQSRPPASAADTLHQILKDYDAFESANDPIDAGERGDLAAAAR
jgi:hypothetical protein